MKLDFTNLAEHGQMSEKKVDDTFDGEEFLKGLSSEGRARLGSALSFTQSALAQESSSRHLQDSKSGTS